jgi:PIN domain nuclease of toxin-antitoxin system
MTPSAVIDTHTAVWYLNADGRLSDRARRFIDEAGRRGVPVLISSIALVEVVYRCERTGFHLNPSRAFKKRSACKTVPCAWLILRQTVLSMILRILNLLVPIAV